VLGFRLFQDLSRSVRHAVASLAQVAFSVRLRRAVPAWRRSRRSRPPVTAASRPFVPTLPARSVQRLIASQLELPRRRPHRRGARDVALDADPAAPVKVAESMLNALHLILGCAALADHRAHPQTPPAPFVLPDVLRSDRNRNAVQSRGTAIRKGVDRSPMGGFPEAPAAPMLGWRRSHRGGDLKRWRHHVCEFANQGTTSGCRGLDARVLVAAPSVSDAIPGTVNHGGLAGEPRPRDRGRGNGP
jgi:hypothetical protein